MTRSLAAAIGFAGVLASASPEGLVLPDPVEITQQRLDQLAKEVEEVKREEARWHDLYDPRSMPSFYQTDPAWSATPYAGGTIGSSGCGLTAAAMAASWWSRSQVTPPDLVARYGDSCITGGLNDMRKFSDRLCQDYGLARSDRYYSISRAMDEARGGSTVFASVRSRFGGGYYTGHIVLIWWDGANLRVSDPANQSNTRSWSAEELLAQTCWKYFYSLRKE